MSRTGIKPRLIYGVSLYGGCWPMYANVIVEMASTNKKLLPPRRRAGGSTGLVAWRWKHIEAIYQTTIKYEARVDISSLYGHTQKAAQSRIHI